MLRRGTGAATFHGFSLVELMITMALLALLLAAAGPSVSIALRNIQIRNVAESIQNGLQKTRSEAVRRNQKVTFWLLQGSTTDPKTLDNTCVSSGTDSSWVISRNTPVGKCAAAPSEANDPLIIEKYPAGNVGVTVAGVQSDGVTSANCVTFNGFGRAVAEAPCAANVLSRVMVTDTALNSGDVRTLRVDLGLSGNIRMCDVKVTDASDPRKCP